MEQVDLIDSNIQLIFKGKSITVIGAQILVHRDNEGGAIKINFIEENTLMAGIYGITGNLSDMSRMIRTFSATVPSGDITGKGRYVNVSEIGNDLCLMLTKEGRSAVIEFNGVVDFLFDDMEKGAQLELHLATIHPKIVGPSVTVFVSAYQKRQQEGDDRIWHYPKCKTHGLDVFWKDLIENNWVILSKGKLQRR